MLTYRYVLALPSVYNYLCCVEHKTLTAFLNATKKKFALVQFKFP